LLALYILHLHLISICTCRWLASKEIHKEDLRYWKREIPQLMCEMQKYLPPTFFNAQEHYLIHLVEEIEICGPVHTRSMWLVERHLKALKAFVRQRSRPEGSMVEGYMLYQSTVYFSEYLPQVVGDMDVPLLWDANTTNKFKGEVLLGKGRWRKVKGKIVYCI
jgi:hypothetical protein